MGINRSFGPRIALFAGIEPDGPRFCSLNHDEEVEQTGSITITIPHRR